MEVSNTQSCRLGPLYTFMNWYRGTPGRLGYIELDDDWKSDVAEVIQAVKFVVVDLSTPTVNVTWELEMAVEEKGVDRVVVLACDGPSAEAARSRYPGIPVLAHSSRTLDAEMADLLTATLGPPKWAGRVGLAIALKRGASFSFWAFMFFREVASTVRKGLRP